jgi:hypothetical protein
MGHGFYSYVSLPEGNLMVWNMFYDFPDLGNFIIPTDELHHCSEGFKPPAIELYDGKI